MKICFVCSEYPPGPHGGIGTCVQVLGRGLARAGHVVRVVGVYRQDYPAADYEEDQSVRVWRLRTPSGRFAGVRSRYRLYRMISRWIRHGEVDLVEVPDWEGWSAGWPRLPVPVVVRANNPNYFVVGLGEAAVSCYRYWLERAGFRRADRWCAVSRFMATQCSKFFALKSGPGAILFNPVDVPDGPALPRSTNQVVFTGTLVFKKGIVSLIEAWSTVAAEHPEAELHVYGKDRPTRNGGSMIDLLRSKLSGVAVSRAFFHGHVSRERVYAALRTARVAVFPSYAEAFGLAPVESMACGCPTIFTTRTAGPEVIQHGRDGLLVEPDQPCQIAASILRVLRDDALAKELGAAGYQTVLQKFTIDVLLPQNIAFYEETIQRFHAGRS